MPGYNAFIPGYLSPQGFTITLNDEEVSVASGLQGTLVGPIEADSPEELGDALLAAVGMHQAAMQIYPEDAEDQYPPPVEAAPVITQEQIESGEPLGA
jgi:hypothetical protein